jgi:hypothetical protein
VFFYFEVNPALDPGAVKSRPRRARAGGGAAIIEILIFYINRNYVRNGFRESFRQFFPELRLS